jgi:hypothetical protein
MQIQIAPPGLADDLRDRLRYSGFIALVHPGGVVEAHDPRAASEREARMTISSALSAWQRENAPADANLVDILD